MDAIIIGASLITDAILLWTLWARRLTWRNRWETAGTLNVGFMTIAALLVAPRPSLGSVIGRWCGAVMHLCNMQFFLAHLCALGGEGAIISYAVSRLMSDNEFRIWFLTRVQLPMGVGMGAMFTLFAESSASSTPNPRFLMMPVTGPYFAAYWVVYGTLILYLLYHSMRGFLDLWHDPPSRRLANVYLLASYCALIATLIRIVTAIVWPWQTTVVADISFLSMSLSVTLFTLGAALAWIRRVRWFTARPGWGGVTAPRFQPRYRRKIDTPPNGQRRAGDGASTS